MSGSKAGYEREWSTRSLKMTRRIRGYLDRRRLPYVMEREDGAIVLQLKKRPLAGPCI